MRLESLLNGQRLDTELIVRDLPGASRPRQILASDGRIYAVKRPNNPQTPNALAAEWLATALMAAAGAPVPNMRLIDIDGIAGPSLAIPYAVDPREAIIYDFLPIEASDMIGNLESLVGAFVLDRWLANADSRQVVYFRKNGLLSNATLNIESDSFTAPLRAMLIDQGCCLNGPEWNLRVGPRHCPTREKHWLSLPNLPQVLHSWINRVQDLSLDVLKEKLASVPQQWLPEYHDPELLLKALRRRQERLGELVVEAGNLQFGLDWAEIGNKTRSSGKSTTLKKPVQSDSLLPFL